MWIPIGSLAAPNTSIILCGDPKQVYKHSRTKSVIFLFAAWTRRDARFIAGHKEEL